MNDISDGIPGALLIAADDIDDAQEQISAAFNTIHIKAVGPGHDTRIRVWRNYAGVLGIDDVDYFFDMTYHMEAPDQILLCRMLSGAFEETHYRQPTRRHGIGAAMAFGAIPHPVQGRVEKARYHMVSVPRPTLAQVAGDHPDSDAVQLISTTPWSEAANQYVVDVVDHLRFGLLSNPIALREPLIVGAAARYLAAGLLAAFPHTAGEDRQFGGELDNFDALRRATSFIDDNAHLDISPADVADAARVSAPTLRWLFRRHRNHSPAQYLRQVRLAQAHRSLALADPETNTVAGIARRWGFWRLDRFHSIYRRTYGATPEHTLDQ
ncbi:DNA-binding protein [Mycolicibacterium duvalii]|uniref:Uncharacterized protein n=1 Tax=Mycolicibacterium duvalii TaxID=39688 RepID=A0A7I7K4M3_9MYCO|nr:helix-turn-helix transcriptional regulator [Mycolicibacterium duvalii]MCV7367128.1 helix-turn-helix transcriptional regulator [Mycolicibacterium duvalii]PEG42887.1 DNA-binding protein [Mycolicibacterium duvalii]BBX18322.1 hypothetical protein MDUV_31820 [Mycolicibacterium duvalii]